MGRFYGQGTHCVAGIPTEVNITCCPQQQPKKTLAYNVKEAAAKQWMTFFFFFFIIHNPCEMVVSLSLTPEVISSDRI